MNFFPVLSCSRDYYEQALWYQKPKVQHRQYQSPPLSIKINFYFSKSFVLKFNILISVVVFQINVSMKFPTINYMPFYVFHAWCTAQLKTLVNHV